MNEANRTAIPELSSLDARVKVGRWTYGSPKLMLWADTEHIEIGSFCSIAEEVTILGGGEHRVDWISTFPLRIGFNDPLAGRDGHPASKGATRIGNDVWIGYRATILSGVTIGDGAVIGAGAVVTRDVLPYRIVAGNPAVVVRERFDESRIQSLLAIRWWDWPLSKIKKATPIICSNDVAKLIAFSAEHETYLVDDATRK